MALDWLGGGKVDHPMADPERAREIVAELPAGDAAKALAEITEWLDSLNHTDGFKLDRRFENTDLLDGAARNHQRKLAQEYLAMPRQQKFQENRLWTGVFGFWKQLGDAYIRCVNEHESGASGATAIRKSLPVILARAMRALAVQLKLDLLRYGPVDPRIWSELARFYRFAEQKGYVDGVIAMYPGAHGESTIKREFLKGLMLSASSTDGLLPLRQDLAEHAVAHFSPSFRLSNQPDGCTHCFDLATAKPPVRLFKGAAPTATMRFFGAGEALARLNQLIGHVTARGALPQDVSLGGNYEKEFVLWVLGHMAQVWSDKPPARGSERRPVTGRITVVPGMNEILGALEPRTSNDTLDFSSEQDRNVESWIVENMSDGGYGAIIPPKKSDWVKVGALIGVQGEAAKYWGVGLVRRIAQDAQQQRRVGIQLLSKTAIPVKVSKAESSLSFVANREPQLAILLSTAPDQQGEVGMVMREGHFNGRDSLEMMVKDKSYLLMPSKMVEDGEDFDWAKFKVMQRSA